MLHPSLKIREKLMRVSAERDSPDYFHGLHDFEPWLNGERLDGCVFADEYEGVIKIVSNGEVVERRGLVEIRPKRRLRVVG